MKKTRSLALRSETLTEITSADLSAVVGGASYPWGGCTTDTGTSASALCQWTFNTCECAG